MGIAYQGINGIPRLMVIVMVIAYQGINGNSIGINGHTKVLMGIAYQGINGNSPKVNGNGNSIPRY